MDVWKVYGVKDFVNISYIYIEMYMVFWDNNFNLSAMIYDLESEILSIKYS